jgi:hypothetical protein
VWERTDKGITLDLFDLDHENKSVMLKNNSYFGMSINKTELP